MENKHWLYNLLVHLGESPTSFSRSIGIKRETRISNVLNGRNNISAELCKLIKEAYPEVRMYWLMTGEGDMFENVPNKKELPKLDIYSTYLIPLSAMSVCIDDLSKLDNLERITSPIKNVDYAITVNGDSMSPEYPNGSIILIKRINHHLFIEWGKTYVLNTCNGIIIKNVRKSIYDDRISCHSINPDYDSFDIYYSDIYSMYKVLMCLISK